MKEIIANNITYKRAIVSNLMTAKRFLVLTFCYLCIFHIGYAQNNTALQQELDDVLKEHGKYSEPYAESLFYFIGYLINQESAEPHLTLDYLSELCDVCKVVYGPTHELFCNCVLMQGLFLGEIKKYNEAIDCINLALSINTGLYDAEISENLGYFYFSNGNYKEALKCYQDYSSMIKNQVGEDDSLYAVSLQKLGVAYSRLSMFEEELDCYLAAEAILEKSYYWKSTLEYAEILRNIALTYLDFGDYQESLEYHNKALRIYNKLESPEEQLWYNARTNKDIGLLYAYWSQFDKALEHTLYAKKQFEDLGLFESSEYAGTIGNLGIIYNDIGQHDLALQYHKWAFDLIRANDVENLSEYATALDNIGVSQLRIGKIEEALASCKEAYRILSRTEGDNYSVITKLGNICIILNEMGQYEETLIDLQKISTILRNSIGESNSLYAKNLANISDVYLQMGQIDSASIYNKESLRIYDSLQSKNDEDYFFALQQKAGIAIHRNDLDSAIMEFSALEKLKREYIVNHLFSFTTQQRNDFWGKNRYFYQNVYLMLTSSNPLYLELLYNNVLFSKGLLLNTEMEARKLILESGDEKALELYEKIRGSRAYLDKLYESPEGRQHEIDSLNNLLEMRQIKLAKRIKEFEDYSRNLTIKWEDVKNVLGKKDIAIEFANYTSQDTTHYIALTLKSDYTEPHLVELFNDKELEGTNPRKQTWYTQATSTNLIWGNLADELRGVDNVYFSPVGELNNIGIEYLLDEEGKHILSEKRNYYRLSSTRELVKEHKVTKAQDAVVYGGIYYDATPKSKLTGKETETELLAKSASRQYMLDSLPMDRGEKWDYLPGTKKEAETIASTFKKNKVRNELLEGEVATEESFKALDGAKKDIIHIATHGFYYTEKEARKKFDLAFMMNGENRAPKEDKMMTRSGLLFAGAKNTFDGKEIPRDVEDGIVTAKDISRLDLRGCDLAVLSACQSGLGDIKGDGVFGLQRGFKKAGVQTLVMSLWKVDDEATRIMMTRFYENMLKGKSKYEAFKEAQSYLRKKYDNPYYYAAFIILDAME